MKIIIAVLLWLLAAPALAGIVTLQPSGANCTYQRIEVGQLGNVVVTCKEASLVVPTPNPVCSLPGQPPSHCQPGTPTPPPPPPPAAGCNHAAIQPPLPWGTFTEARAASGQVKAYPITGPSPYGGENVTFTQGQQPASPRTITEFSVSTCPGVINTTPGPCYWRSTGISYNTLPVAFKPTSGMCVVQLGGAPYYINVRWTYPDGCPYAACGFTLQWAPS